MRLLLDSRLPRALAERLRRHQVDCLALAEWLGGDYLDAPDDLLLEAALNEQRVLVSADCRTLPILVKDWGESKRHHAGIVLIDGRSQCLADIGSLVRAICCLNGLRGNHEWTDQVIYLVRPSGL